MSKLDVLLGQAVAAKEATKKAKEEEKRLIDQVKILLDQEGITKDTISGVKVNYTTCTKSSMNENKLLKIIKDLAQDEPQLLSCIETVEIINENVLEELIYQGYITADDIQPAYEETTYKTLKLKKVK